MTDDCKHGYIKSMYSGEEVFTKYTFIFCPDCGERIEDNYKSRPFHL
jgi:DNA-directed RNA polymerase subunit RPC12/RpoP